MNKKKLTYIDASSDIKFNFDLMNHDKITSNSNKIYFLYYFILFKKCYQFSANKIFNDSLNSN